MARELVWGMEKHIRQPNANGTHGSSDTGMLEGPLGASERDLRIIWGWNAGPIAAEQRCVHNIIAQQAQQHPGALAVCSWDGSLDYQQLGRLSSRLAQHLVSLGAGPRDIIPLYFEQKQNG